MDGPPVSLQTKNRPRLQDWKARVRDAAQSFWPSGDSPSDQNLRISITYYFDTASPDVDNIIKPIQDTLIGLVYIDDNQIMDTSCGKRDINGSFKIRGASSVLVKGFTQGNEFLFVRVNEMTDLEEVRQ
ncbi:RusA family crossover junction endodeoxyribonuclease [Paenibacillus sp. V4I3]|uniref:RusA family crossover junction endodeoxyribonuclease n=1 Tax=Paenibacillus sp. V4I3 TaxID=3042305 RepID=UPI0027D8C64E|nr:RusA family crossover junction endodeoxyribonuclease [Paenibacillus sp. V4I3]